MVKPLRPSPAELEARRRDYQRRAQGFDRLLFGILALGTVLLAAALVGALVGGA